MMKRIYLMCVALLACAFNAVAYMDASKYTRIEQDGIYYFLNNTTSQAYVCSKHDYPKNYREDDFEGKEPTYKGKITIPDVVISDSESYDVVCLFPFAFYGCVELEELILPSSVFSIESYALSECGNIKINTMENIQGIGESAFYNTWINNDLTLNLPSATIMGNYAFDGSKFKKVTLGSNLQYFDSFVFSNSNIDVVEFQGEPDGEPLQMSARAFSGFIGREIRLPNKPIKVVFEMFHNCPNLERVVFPPITEYKHIHDFQTVRPGLEGCYTETTDMIYKCPNMKEVVCYAVTPPLFYWHDYTYTNFCIINKPDCVLKVPVGSEELYKADPVWGEFQIIEGFEPGEYTSISGVAEDATSGDAVAEYYNLQGIKVDNPSTGNVYIRRIGTKVDKVVF